MFQIRKFKLMRPFFGWIWALKPDFIGTDCLFLEQVSDFYSPSPPRGWRVDWFQQNPSSDFLSLKVPSLPEIVEPHIQTIQISRFWFWNFGVRGSVETRVLPAKLIL